jgi:hypothetical protein
MNDQTQINENGFSTANPAPSGDDSSFYPQNDQPSASSSDILIDIKQKALAQLTPMVNNLDQLPEERFKTIMMIIQASDNQDLIKDAYQAAGTITDEKARAQALLDIVNEINYFTQHSS